MNPHIRKISLGVAGAILLLACQDNTTQVLTSERTASGPPPASLAVTTGSMVAIEAMAVTLSPDNAPSINYAHPPSANYMIVFASATDTAEASNITATFNGVALQKISQTTFLDVRTALFVMEDASSGTHTLAASFTGGTPQHRSVAVYSLSNVGGLRDASVTTGIFSQDTSSVTVDSSVGDLVIDHHRWRQSETEIDTVGPRQTSQLTTSVRQRSTSAPGAPTSTTMSQSTTNVHGGNDAVHYAVSLEPRMEDVSPPPTSTIGIEWSAITDSEGDTASIGYNHPKNANYLVVFASAFDGQETANIAATYNGVPLEEVSQTGFLDVRTSLFVMKNPPPGLHALEATFSGGTPTHRAVAVYSLSNVRGIRDWGVSTGIFSQNTMQVTVDSSPGDLVLDHLRWRQHSTLISAIGGHQTPQLADSWRRRQNSTFAGGATTSTTMSQSTTTVHGGNDAVYFALSLEPGIDGIWVTPSDLLSEATSGDAWDELADDASSLGTADISDQHSTHDVRTLAAALMCFRTDTECDTAREGIDDAMGTEDDALWLAVSRNLGSYIIAADLLDLRGHGHPDSLGTRVQEWMEDWVTRQQPHNNPPFALRGFQPFSSGANASAQEGFVYAALAAYLEDEAMLDRAWDAFRTYACDTTAPDHENINLNTGLDSLWAHDDEHPCAVNPAGTTKADGGGVHRRIDGAIIGDIARGGAFAWPPGCTQYPWVGLEGFVPAALVLQRAGYPAFEVADYAVWRAADYLYFLEEETSTCSDPLEWFDTERAAEVKHLINVIYGTSFVVVSGIGAGRTVGYTDWTHRD